MTVNLHNARVLVVGASSGIGLATAHAFADAGAKITMASRGGDTLVRAASEVGRDAQPRTLDTRDEDAMARFFEQEPPCDHVAISASSTASGPVRVLAVPTEKSVLVAAIDVARAGRYAARQPCRCFSPSF